MASFTRTADGKMIDGEFEIKRNNSDDNSSYLASDECKNWNDFISVSELISCLEKADNHQLSNIIGTRSRAQWNENSKLINLTEKKKSNLYLYSRSGREGAYVHCFEPFKGNEQQPDPAMICLVIETDVITGSEKILANPPI